MAAVTETRQYLARVKQDRLAQLWTGAGIDLTAVAGELAIDAYLDSRGSPNAINPDPNITRLLSYLGQSHRDTWK